MINDLMLVDSISTLSGRVIVIYGAGAYGRELCETLEEAGFPASYFCDSDSSMRETFVNGIRVLHHSVLTELDKTESIAIIIASEKTSSIDEAALTLKKLNIGTDHVFTAFALTLSLIRSGMAASLHGGHYMSVLHMSHDVVYAQRYVHYLQRRTKWAGYRNVCLVYSCPKTGCTTIHRSLAEAGISSDHMHTVSKFDTLTGRGSAICKMLAEHESRTLDILRTRESVKVVSMVRDPIGRCISHIFQNTDGRIVSIADMPAGNSFAECVVRLVQLRAGSLFELPDWFDSEIKATFGIDVFAHPFDTERGYTIIKHGNTELLLMKLEKLSGLESVIGDFFGTANFSLVSDNIGENKPYKYLYKKIKENIQVPREVLDSYYNDPRMRHFYTDEEIAGFWKKWENNIA